MLLAGQPEMLHLLAEADLITPKRILVVRHCFYASDHTVLATRNLPAMAARTKGYAFAVIWHLPGGGEMSKGFLELAKEKSRWV